ncbi:MAG: large repetitive protein, partial [Acidobacteriota bacterium]|nr:large repetitive protein [Acidobacteriota bacterium]
MRVRVAAALVLLLLCVPSFAAVTGTVMTTDGTAVAGAKLTLLPFETTEARAKRLLAGAPGPEALASTTSDAKGNFTLEMTTAAVADLRIEATGTEPQTTRVERDEELGPIALRKAAPKEGRVTANGKPVANARVIWWGNAGHILSQTTTDGEGRYVSPDPRNATAVTVLHPDFAVSEELFWRRGENTAKEMDRTLMPGKAIAGRVVAADGETAVAKATIVVDGWPLATSAEDGSFTVAHAPAKWKLLVALSDGSLAMRRFTADVPLTLRLGKAPVLRGTVRDAKTQQPLANVEVRVSVQESNVSWAKLTDAKGNYSRADLPPGSYRLSFLHPAYTAELTEVGLAAGAATKDARLTPQARVSGTVVDEEKRAVAGASLAPEEATGDRMPRMFRPAGMTFSGPDGRFLMRVAGDQEIKIRANKKGLPETKSETMRLAPAERKRGVTIVIPSGIAVSGRVTDREGNPLSGVAVAAAESENANGPMRRMIILNTSSDDDQTVRTGTDGTFTTRLREGTYD